MYKHESCNMHVPHQAHLLGMTAVVRHQIAHKAFCNITTAQVSACTVLHSPKETIKQKASQFGRKMIVRS